MSPHRVTELTISDTLRAMRAITMFRAAAWFGVAIVVSSLVLVKWGNDELAKVGPPAHFERHVVGAVLLGFVAALSISVSGRGGHPPSWIARGLGGACAGLVVLLAYLVYAKAHDIDHPFFLGGQGWTWMLCGGGMLLGAMVGTLGIKPVEEEPKRGKSRGKRRKRKR